MQFAIITALISAISLYFKYIENSMKIINYDDLIVLNHEKLKEPFKKRLQKTELTNTYIITWASLALLLSIGQSTENITDNSLLILMLLFGSSLGVHILNKYSVNYIKSQIHHSIDTSDIKTCIGSLLSPAVSFGILIEYIVCENDSDRQYSSIIQLIVISISLLLTPCIIIFTTRLITYILKRTFTLIFHAYFSQNSIDNRAFCQNNGITSYRNMYISVNTNVPIKICEKDQETETLNETEILNETDVLKYDMSIDEDNVLWVYERGNVNNDKKHYKLRNNARLKIGDELEVSGEIK